ILGGQIGWISIELLHRGRTSPSTHSHVQAALACEAISVAAKPNILTILIKTLRQGFRIEPQRQGLAAKDVQPHIDIQNNVLYLFYSPGSLKIAPARLGASAALSPTPGMTNRFARRTRSPHGRGNARLVWRAAA